MSQSRNILAWVLHLALALPSLLPGTSRAQNSTVPPGVYIADPSSRDESPDYYCS